MTFIGPSSQITAHLGDADGASTLLDWQPVAELHAPSGALLPCDGTRYHPSLAATAARLCVPTDRPLTLWLRFLAKGDQLTRVAGLRVTFEGTPMEQATLPRTGIDTASLLIADAGALEHRWRVGGPHNETLLYTASGSIPDALLDRIRAAGWPIRPGRFFPRFERPLEDEDLAAITAWLAEHAPEVSLNPVVHETAHRIERARGDRHWIPLVDEGEIFREIGGPKVLVERDQRALAAVP